jgi:hypothetical protein
MRRIIPTIHLWAGLAAALFLFALVSDSLVGFENDAAEWRKLSKFFNKLFKT